VADCKTGFNGDDPFAIWSQGALAHDIAFTGCWATTLPTTEPYTDWSNCFAIYGGGQNLKVSDSGCEHTSNGAVKISYEFGGNFDETTSISISNVGDDDGKPVCYFAGGRDVLLQQAVEGCEWADPGTIVNAYSGKCLDLPNGEAFHGATLQQWDCNGMPNQQWMWVDNQIHYAPDAAWCVESGDINWQEAGFGHSMFLWDCNEGANQQLSWDPDMHTIYFDGTFDPNQGFHTLCMEVPDGHVDAGTALWTWECNGHANQRWEVGPSPSLQAVQV
jgi:hypothetical protein